MKTIKVAHIATVDSTVRFVLLNQLLSIKDAGYEVVGISAPGENVSYINEQGIQHFSVPFTRNFTPLQDLKALWCLYKLLRKEKFTIVHTHNPKPGLIGQLAAKLSNTPIVINTIHGFYFHENMKSYKKAFYVLIEKLAGSLSDIILSQSSEDVNTAIEERICNPEKIIYLGNGINLNVFNRNAIDQDLLIEKKRELGIKDSDLVVGFVGRLVEEKGILELLEAIKMVISTVINVKLLIIGPTDYAKKDALTSEVAKKYGLENVCIFAGQRTDMPYLYSLMDVFVLPSHREGFPRAPMEASAMGVPCIVTNVRGCREVVKNGKNGFVVPLNDIKALAVAISSLLLDRQIAKTMSKNAVEISAKEFDEKRVFEKVIAEYKRIAGKKGIP